MLRHLEGFRRELDPKPPGWTGGRWPGRKLGTYQWFEIQDSVDYWELFERPKLMYQDIAWTPGFCLDVEGLYPNNTIYILPTSDRWLLTVLNSPVFWWVAWRGAQHGKDEALRMFRPFRIHITDGSHHDVLHPQQCVVLPRSIIVGQPGTNLPTIVVTDYVDIALIHITKLEPLQSPSSPSGDGEASA